MSTPLVSHICLSDLVSFIGHFANACQLLVRPCQTLSPLTCFITGISGAAISELNAISSDPDSKFVIFLSSFTDFPGLVDDIATAT
jgi:hypothetical protein